MDSVQPYMDRLGKPTTEFYLERDGARLIATHTFKDVAQHLPSHIHNGTREVGDVVALQIHAINSYNSTTALEFKLGGMVLRCLNGMTAFDSLFNLRFLHLADNWNGTLPRPEFFLNAFQKNGERWKQYAETALTHAQRTTIVNDGLELGVLPRTYYKREESRFNGAETAWDLYNAFTWVGTHAAKRVQQSGRLNRMDRINILFENALAPAA